MAEHKAGDGRPRGRSESSTRGIKIFTALRIESLDELSLKRELDFDPIGQRREPDVDQA